MSIPSTCWVSGTPFSSCYCSENYFGWVGGGWVASWIKYQLSQTHIDLVLVPQLVFLFYDSSTKENYQQATGLRLQKEQMFPRIVMIVVPGQDMAPRTPSSSGCHHRWWCWSSAWPAPPLWCSPLSSCRWSGWRGRWPCSYSLCRSSRTQEPSGQSETFNIILESLTLLCEAN